MDSPYLIRIIRANGEPVTLLPGRTGERDFITDVVTRTIAKGVGMWKTEAQVRAALESALHESLHDLKSDVQPVFS